jgi:hypothetical protein
MTDDDPGRPVAVETATAPSTTAPADSPDTDVAVIGAGPYGLSLAAHLSGRGVRHEIFGTPMDTWRHHMPAGMCLKSEGFASNLSDPDDRHTLERFCAEAGIEYGRIAVPISLDTYCHYGIWFQQRVVPELRTETVERLARAGQGFELTLAGGETLRARRVVVASGVQGQAYVPPELRQLPADLLVHTYEQSDPAATPPEGAVVIGAGQSALEAAALIAESGRPVRLVCRRPEIVWLGKPGGRDRPLRKRWRYPESGLGEGRAQWAYSNHPLAFHAMPERWRLDKAFSTLGPGGAWWLRPRFERQVEILSERRIVEARADGGAAHLRLQGPAGAEELTAALVVAGTGYRTDLGRLPFLAPDLSARVATLAGAPALDRSFQSSVPGLYFVGFLATPSFGPVMRFAYGARFAARRISARLAARSSLRA